MDSIDDYPDLDFSSNIDEDYDTAMNTKKFYIPDGNDEVGIGRSRHFVSHPTVVHFGGFTVNEYHEQTISVVNCSSHSQRLSILPPTTDYYKITFTKCGLLAPGMSQKITIKFRPLEYKYHYDCIRIHADGQDLLIPIHGYPVINQVDFPTLISFGDSPLCEPAQKTIKLRCSIPINFSFSIEIIQPHPYFTIKPVKGVVPANGSVGITITFNPITLGTCTTVVRLFLAQHNFKPIEAVINARAVSGILEEKAIREVEARLTQTMMTKGRALAETLGKSSFKQTSSIQSPETTEERPEGNETISTLPYPPREKKKSHSMRNRIDPVATVLKKTFGANDLDSALSGALMDQSLLTNRVPTMIESGPMNGTKKVVGDKKALQKVHPRGIGSGNVFDAGAEYIAEHNRQLAERTGSVKTVKSTATDGAAENEKVLDGLRIPDKLNSTASVNFVLTQEVGKLKPKDLKIAIEKNREERRKQEEEQQRIREEGGGGEAGGALDLRAVLADEKLNSEPGDAFKRQLREMAFLADVDEVKKMEVEKTFRVSEEFIGASMLSQDDIKVVMDQRKANYRHRKRAEWRNSQSRMHTKLFIAASEEARAGAPTKFTYADGELPAHPKSFDTNKNDIWGKRMNTLRRLVGFVSKWIIQRRVMRRLEKFRTCLKNAGVVDAATMKEFVEMESSDTHRPDVAAPTGLEAPLTESLSGVDTDAEPQSLSVLVCSMPNQSLVRRAAAESAMMDGFNFNSNMARRVLFPKFVADEVSTRKKMESVPIDDPIGFDDRTFFPLKTRAEYVDMEYGKEAVPNSPLYFLPVASTQMSHLFGATEEQSVRPPAGGLYTPEDIKTLLAGGSDGIFGAPEFPLPPAQPEHKPEETHGSVRFDSSVTGGEISSETADLVMESDLVTCPAWMTDTRHKNQNALYSEPSADRDVFRTRPEFRTYIPHVMTKETDPDWVLRAGNTKLEFDKDNSLRAKLLDIPGFESAHTYLLASYSSRIGDPFPPPGPTLTDFYMPDTDRHGSGLFCMSNDHQRALTEEDHDVRPLQNRLAREDCLTDSESDEEESYHIPPPSMDLVKQVLRPPTPPPAEEVNSAPEKGKKGKKNEPTSVSAAAANSDVPPSPSKTIGGDTYSALDEADRRVDQVELMRDRKTLEYEAYMKKCHQQKVDNFTERLIQISEASTCPLQSLPVQLPLHQYEEEMLSVLEEQVPPLSNSYIEQGLNTSLGSPSRFGLSTFN